jgi:hypothetical protein
MQILSYQFDPATVAPGQSSVVTVVAENCGTTPLSTLMTWTTQMSWPIGGIPPGCPILDPVLRPVTIPAVGKVSQGVGYAIPANCLGTLLRVTVRIALTDGTTLASRTAELTIGKPLAPCRISYTRESEWTGGFVASVTITNTGTTEIAGWSAGFAFAGDQRITNVWNAVVNQSGAAVSAGALSYNRTIAPGASTSFGFLGSWTASDAPPTTFTLNGSLCATG